MGKYKHYDEDFDELENEDLGFEVEKVLKQFKKDKKKNSSNTTKKAKTKDFS